jgi:hypothetical protein
MIAMRNSKGKMKEEAVLWQEGPLSLSPIN